MMTLPDLHEAAGHVGFGLDRDLFVEVLVFVGRAKWRQ
jgi:hypothetical protein